MKEWLFLIGAIVLETFATTMLKYSEQFTKLLPTIGMLAGYLLSFYCLSHALRTLPIGIAYAIWSALYKSEGQVFDFFVKRSITCPRDLPDLSVMNTELQKCMDGELYDCGRCSR